ncbi:MAG: HAD-IA family hydrolase, partial [Treponema sp.]|nr:HAD-IA family hydrolase [Treponema sp.]
AILTNSPREHADRILGRLGFEGLFTHIFDIRMCNFIGKPQPVFFNKALDTLGVQAETVLFIDDGPRYVEGFIKLGGNGVLYDENNQHPDFPHPRIQRLREITAFLK